MIGLGVSVVGFAVMGYKLNKLRASVAELASVTAHNHDEVMGALKRVERDLIEVKMIGLESRELIQAALAEVRAVRRDLLDGYMARISTEVDLLRRAVRVDDAHAISAFRTFGETRRWVQSTIDASPASPAGDVHWLDRLVRYRVLAMTWVAEVHLHRRVGDPEGAVALARDAATTSRAWSRNWGDTLLPPTELEGAFRFAHRQLEDVPRETFHRLVQRETGRSPIVGDPREMAASSAVAQALPRLGPDWLDKQRAIAPMVDFVEEAAQRFESLADEMELCRRDGLTWAQWEELPAPANSGLVLIAADG